MDIELPPTTQRVPEAELDAQAEHDAPDGEQNEEWLRTVPITDDHLDGGARAVAEAARAAEASSGAEVTVTDVSEMTDLDWDDEESSDEIVDEDTHLGTTIDDRYEVIQILGEGGMGRVYLARHIKIGKKVAIKVLHAELAKDKEAVGRFVREARAASSIGNAHIVDISDFGELSDGSTFFVMEYLEGPTLADLIEDGGALPAEKVVDIALQLCEGLGAAHDQQIVHRDLKPENITLVERGGRSNFCKILDFGIAKVSGTSSTTKLTMAGAVFGTPHYMSPEQAAGASVDHRTDIYSLGVMLYEMIAGELPFQADNFMGILTQHMYKAPVPLRSLVSAPECPPGLEAIVLKCLTKKPDGRYATMAELGEDLGKFQDSGMSDAVDEMMARSGSFNVPADYFNNGVAVTATAAYPAQPPRSNSGAIVGGAVVLLALLGGGAYFALSNGETKPAAPAAPTVTVTVSAAPEPTVTAEVTASASAAPPAPNTTRVLVYSDATGAQATVEGTDKAITLPDTFDIKEGDKLRLKVTADGFQPETVEIDDSKPKVQIKLKPVIRRAYPRMPRPNQNPEVAEPWDN